MSTTMADVPVPTDADAGVEALFREHYPSMVRLAHLLLRDPALAEDVAQEAFVDLHQRWGRVADPVPYLRSCVLNRSRSRLRSLIRRRMREDSWAVTDDAGDVVELAVVRASAAREVADLVRGLPRRQREVVVLRFWADLSEAEIAATLGISAGSVKSHTSRAMAALSARAGELR